MRWKFESRLACPAGVFRLKKGGLVLRPTTYKLKYKRRQGLQRTYDITVTVVQYESGVFRYQSWVHFAREFKGNGLVYPLSARTPELAAAEARARIEGHIETLAGLKE
jgi:hypothetical protein